jgi:hypothetical protein
MYTKMRNREERVMTEELSLWPAFRAGRPVKNHLEFPLSIIN